MKQFLAACTALALLSACGQDSTTAEVPADASAADVQQPSLALEAPTELQPGLTATLLKKGYGRVAVPGDRAEVHYTGWLYDPNAEGNRGKKFDSSVDRGQPFSFPLGAGRVIKGWDQGVAGMMIGEKRELLIQPDMAYGARGAGDVIPPNATLIFEVELLGLQGPGE